MKVSADGEIYTFDPNRFGNKELMAIEKATGMTAVQWERGLNEGSMIAATSLIWTLRKRLGQRSADGGGPLTFDEVEFDAVTLDLMVEDEEEGKGSPPDGSSDTNPAEGSSTPTTTTSSPSSTDGDSDPGNPTG